MARCRFFALLSLALAITVAKTGRSQELKHVGYEEPIVSGLTPAGNSQEHTCVIYKLDELGDDLDLGKWIAETIPEVIEPGTWKGQGVLRYHGPKKILVVYHTPAVQAKVDGFLKNVKKSMPATKAKPLSAHKPFAHDRGIVPAQYRASAPLTTSTPIAEPNSSYPVATPVRQPKHLFHFIIRYEGDGIIDDNVVKFMKAQYQSDKSKSKNSEAAPTTVPSVVGVPTYSVPPVVAPSPGTPSAYGMVPACTVPSVPTPSTTPPSPAAPIYVSPPMAGLSSGTAPPDKKKYDKKKADKEKKEDKQP
jgi:hypothetical protein